MKSMLTVSREIPVIKIALSGRLRSGKDTAANHLYIRHGFDRVAFGDALKRNAHAVFPWISDGTKPRALYQQYGQLMREIDPDIWIKHAEMAVKGKIDFRVSMGAEAIGIVITDLRQPNEYEWAKLNGFTIVRVNSSFDSRLERARKAGDDFVESDLLHSTEQYIDTFTPDFEVNNDGTVDELKEQIDEILEAI
jgi:dephospho-CoA kinase